MSETVEEHRAKRRDAAASAMARGQAALAAGDFAQAERWLDRSRRVSGGNDAVELLLATARLRQSAPDAAPDFAKLAARHDLREAWLGLATALHHAGDAMAAAAALSEALAGHIGLLPAPLHTLADVIARAGGAPGWCCLTEQGAVFTSPPWLASGVELDGRPWPARQSAVPTSGAFHVLCDIGTPLGSPFQLDRMARLDAFVDDDGAGGLVGWAWHPNDPGRSPVLRVTAGDGTSGPVTLGPTGSGLNQDQHATDRPLAQPRAFCVPAAVLPGSGLLRVTGVPDRDITGSPLDPGALGRYVHAVAGIAAGRPLVAESLRAAPLPAGFIGVRRAVAPGVAVPVAIVIPVYRGQAATLACLASVAANTPSGTRVIVVDDASPEPALAAALDAAFASGAIELIRHARNRGFPSTANTGLRAADDADVVLLNADTLVPPHWLARLREAAYAAADIASATPLSNDATLLSYPSQAGRNPVPDRAAVDRVALLADRANRGVTVDIPTGVGFCMYLRRDALNDVGLLREDVFAQGYGEENDWCLRARHLGWRHVAAPGVFVGHVGSVSFGTARTHLLERNLGILNRLHPGYDALIAADACGPALAACRRRIDLAALSAARRRRSPSNAVVLITHDLGGGVQRQVAMRCDALRARGDMPIVLRPVLARPLLLGTGACIVDLDPPLPNLVFDVAGECAALVRLLAAYRPRLVEVHHMLGHDHALMALPARLGVPYEMHVHDYASFCARVTLVGFERRYCGEPDIAGCEHCIADAGRNIDEDIPVATLVARSAREFAGATRVVVPSVDVAARLARHFPAIRAVIEPWDAIRPRACPPPSPATAARPRVVAVLGAIGIEKGFDVLLACARDAADRALPLRFVVLGHTTDDARLLATGAVFITGAYDTPADLDRLIAAESVDVAFLPSIWPETWSFTLSEAWEAGLHVVAFDIGAPAERIRQHGGGTLLPLACRAVQVNSVLVR